MSVDERLLAALQAVHTGLGCAHSEAVYHRALETELRLQGIGYESEVVAPVRYRGHVVGSIRLDLVVGGTVVELKSAPRLLPAQVQQLRKYLAVCDARCGVLVNFGGDQLQVVPITTADSSQSPACGGTAPATAG